MLSLAAALLWLAASPAPAQPAQPEVDAQTAAPTAPSRQAAAPAVEPEPVNATVGETPEKPDMLEDLVDQALHAAGLPSAGNTPTHVGVAIGFFLLALLLRQFLVKWLFGLLRRIAARTPFEFDDYALPPLEAAVRTLMLVVGVVGALKVLKLPPAAGRALEIGYTIAFSLIALVFFLRLATAFLDHLQINAQKKDLNVAPFMPWIKRVVLALVFVFGALMVAQSLGADVHAFLAGLGIGGLAVALAAQDTLANIFGSVVIAVDQPFRVGEFVQIGANSGSVEDIGLRSTKLRTAQKNLISIPNKTVAAEPIVNLTRFIQRRVEQTFGLSYASTPDQMDALVEDIRTIVLREAEVDKTSVIVQFTELNASSLDIWLAYNALDPDFVKHLRLKQRINLAIMRAVAARGMSFAFPTQSIHLASWPEGTAPGAAAAQDKS